MTRWFVALSLALVMAGCKGETKIQDNPETLSALKGCQDSIASKDAYIKELEARAGELERKAGQTDGVVVTIAGDTMTISGKGPNVRAGGSVTADKVLYESFVTQVQAARGAMQRCYQNALKKDSGLQMREVELNIQIRFTPPPARSRAPDSRPPSAIRSIAAWAPSPGAGSSRSRPRARSSSSRSTSLPSRSGSAPQ